MEDRRPATMSWMIGTPSKKRLLLNLCAYLSTVEIDSQREGGKPIMRGTGMTIATLMAEINIKLARMEIAEEYQQQASDIKQFFKELSELFDQQIK